MTSPRPTDLNFALPPGFVPAVRPVPAPAAPVREVPAPAVRRIEPAAGRVTLTAPAPRTIDPPALAPAIESAEPVADPEPRAPRKPRATTGARTAIGKATAPKPTAPKPAAPKTAAPKTAAPKTAPKAAAPKAGTRRRATPAVRDVVEPEAGRILEDAARTAADMLAAARSTAARLNAELDAEHAQRRREMEDAVADLADYLDKLAHRLRTGTPLSVE
jgi:hypothetical protein